MSEKSSFNFDALDTSILGQGLTPLSEVENTDSGIKRESSYVSPIEKRLELLDERVQNIDHLDQSSIFDASELELFAQASPLILDAEEADDQQLEGIDRLTGEEISLGGSAFATAKPINLNQSIFTSGESTRITLEFIQREAAYRNEVGLYRVDDATGRIGDKSPGDNGYAAAALDPARRIVSLDNGAAEIHLGAGIEQNTLFGSYLIQNDTSQKFQQQNSRNRLSEKPLAFFSFSEGNPDNFDHLQTRVNEEGSIDFLWEDVTGGGDQDFNDSVFTLSFGNAPMDTATPNYAVRAEGQFKLRGHGDYDGDPNDLDDDVLIYAGEGFNLAGKPILPVKRDEAGNRGVDEQNRNILVDDAITVAPGYSVGRATNSIKHQYSGLTPPQMVDRQTVDVPDYSVIKQELLETTIALASQEVTLPAFTRLNNASRWSSNFPAPGTPSDPTVVRVQRQGLTIPAQVDLNNYVIIVERGDIKFQGSQHELDNVVLIAESGKIDLGQAEVKDSSLLAAKSIKVRSNTKFVGDNLIANSQGKIEFQNSQSELETENQVRVIAAGDLSIKGHSTIKGEFLTKQDFLAQGRTSVYGSVGAKGDVTFNGRVSLHAIPDKIEFVQVLELNLNLANDTGVNNTDNISSDATVSGSITNQQEDISLSASFDDLNSLDFSDLVQPDGSFTLGIEQLQQINGGDLDDGNYTLYLVATDSGSGVVRNSILTFVLDKAAPTLLLTTPLVDGDHSSRPRLIGNTESTDIDSISYSLDGGEAFVITVDDNGNFDNNLGDEELDAGTHSVTVSATDIAGNQSHREISFQVGDNFFIPNATSGWGALKDSTLILVEQDSYVVETSIPSALGLETNDEGEEVGTRTISFDVDAVWDETDLKAIEDQLLVYLVDPEDPSQTLLDNGSEGTAVFSLAGEQSDFTPGLVSFDGATVTIDASSLTDATEGLLVFQILNQDDDTGSVVTVNNLASTTDPEGFQNPVFREDNNSVPIGEALNLDSLTATTDVETIIEKVRFDASTGEYKAQVSIQNNGAAAISRNSVVLFNDLPDGVELSSPNGIDGAGNPYLNLRPAIRPGGLDRGGVSDFVEVVFTNPNLIRFGLDTTVLVGSPNVAPVFEAIGNLTVIPGEKLEIPLTATDVDGDTVTYKLQSDGDLPTGMLEGNGTLKFNPKPDEIGSYEFTIIATDGAKSVNTTVTLDVVADAFTTTRISGVIENVEQQPLAGVVIELGDLSTVTNADGSFTIETDQPLTDDTLKVRGERIEGDLVYPFIAEKLPLVLGQEVYEGYSNVIDRPIYLPALDVESGAVIDPNVDVTVTTDKIPGASVFVEAGSLSTQDGETFTGTLSITEVPTDLTPAALPENLSPDMVVTIQPGEMVFETPAPLSLPNRAGWAEGMEMDLWSINPETGDFDKVGVGRVSDDGSVVETIEGGIRNSSWHLFAPPPQNPGNSNPPPDCDECQEKFPFKSEVEANSGAVIEKYDLVTYASNGESRGISLTYDSLRADPRPIVKLDYGDIDLGRTSPGALRIIADLTVKGNGIDYQVPGGIGNNHFWSISRQAKNSSISLQADLKEFESGKYDYDFTNGLYLFTRGDVFGSSASFEDKLLHVNSIDSAFGSGWGIAGWQEIVENSDGSLLLIDGDGSELWFDAPENEGEPYVNPPGNFSSLEKLPDGTFRRTMKEGMVYDFNQSNQLASVTDTNGNSTEYVYDSQKQLTKIVDPVGLETVLNYNANGKVSSIIDPAQRETLMEYDGNGNLIGITDPDNSTSQWEYDGGHHMISEIDPEGNRAFATYDQFGRATSATTEDGSVVQIKPVETQGLYSPNATTDLGFAPIAGVVNNRVSYADANGNVISTELDLSGQKISSNDGGGKTNSIERNEDNLVTNQTNARGFDTEYTYDERGNVTQISEDVFSTGLVEETETKHIFPDPKYPFSDFITFTFASGDVNNDGYLDIVTTESVLLGTKDGKFDSRIDYEAVYKTNKVLLEDVDADTNLDLILLGRSGISVFSGNGDGTFGENTYVYSNVDSRVSTIAGTVNDFNQDGILDIVGFNSDGIISQHIGDGSGNFILESEYQIEINDDQFSTFRNGGLDSLLFEDLDLDGDLDLALGYPSNETHQVKTYINNNDGTFTIQDNILLEEVSFGTGTPTAVPKSADLNNDKIPDLIVSYGYYKYLGGGTPSISRIETSVLLGRGDGTFEVNDSYVLDNLSKTNSLINLSDLDNDGNLDLIQSDRKQFSVQLGNGTGNFTEPQYYYYGNLIWSFQVEDWNNDGYLDLGSVDGRENFSVQFGNGDGTFDTYFHLDIKNSAHENFSLQDLNSDGLPDLFGRVYDHNLNRTSLSIATGNGDATFDPFTEVDVELPSGKRFGSLAIENISGDENSDLILFSSGEEYPDGTYSSRITVTTLSIFTGLGDGTFGDRSDYTLSNDVERLLFTRDLNGDQTLDILAQRRNGYLLLFNNGDDSFTEQLLESDSSFYPNLSLGDLDGDQDLDLIDSKKILLNDGNGNFTEETNIPLGEEYNLRLTHIEDLDGDGNLDLVANTYKPFDGSEPFVSVWLGNGNGTFQNRIIYEPDANYNSNYVIHRLKLGDLNSDGIIDLIGGRYNSSSDNPRSNMVFVALGNGDGTFGRETQYNITGTAIEISLADLDLDDDLDLLFGFLLNNIGTFKGVVQDSDIPRQGFTTRLNQTNQSDSTSTLAQRSYTYDPTFNQVTSEIDELGRQTLYDIDSNNGNLLSTTQVVGEVSGNDDVVTSYTYTDAGLVDTMTDPEGRVTDYDYDERGNLVKETDAVGTPDEASLSYEYDLAGNQTAVIDENGNRSEFEYDGKNRLIKSTYAVGTPDEAVETTEYDGLGNQIATVDGNGNRTEYVYDEKDRLIKTIAPDPDGNGALTNPISTSNYDGVGNLIATTDPLVRETRYIYDSRNRLVETILPDGTTTESKYDTDNNLIASSDAAGEATNKIFDARGRLIRETDPQGNVTRYQYDAADQLLAVVDGNGHRTRYEYDELGRQISVTDGEGNVTRTEYDKVGNVVATIDGHKNRTEYEYDERDRNTQVTDAENGTTTTEYDKVGNVISVTDQLTRTTEYTYDSRNRQASITDPHIHTTLYQYDDVGNVTQITDANNHSTSFTFDGLNRQIATTNELKDSKTNTYDALGNLIATTDELGHTTTYTYDLQNRPLAVTDPNGNTTKTEYDERGNVIATIDANSERTEVQYDKLNRQIATVDANEQLTLYEYDAVGNLVSITDPEENVTSYTYDQANRRTGDTNQLGDSRSYEYDPAGNLITTTDRNGRVKTYSFDKLNRTTTEVWLDENDNSIRTFNYNYDKANQLVSVNDSDSAYAYVYDLNSRLIEVDNAGTPSVPNVVFNYDYDPVGNLLSVTDTIEGQVKGIEIFQYDELNRVTKITQSGNDVADKRVDINYDKANQMAQMSRYSDLSGTDLVAQSNYTYDKFGRLTDLNHESETDVLANYNWVYDQTNRLTQFTSPDGIANYTYDDLDQLTGADYDDQDDESYSYDDNGNRTNDGYVTGENNQLLSDGTYNYEYDAEGNRVKRTEIATGTVTEYEWDYRNRLIAVVDKDSSGNVISNSDYTYDVNNNRIAKLVDADGEGSEGAVEERFVLDGNHIALTFDGDGNLTERFLHSTSVDQILAQENPGEEVLWALADHQGSVKMLLGSDGSVVNNITYDAFGGITVESNPNVNFRFGYTGREHDEEIRLDYYGARYRDPSLGRFISEDTVGFAGSDFNLYRYTFNSPLNYTDPSGNTPLVLAPVAVGAIVVVVGAISYLVYDTIQKFVGDPPTTTTATPPKYDPADIRKRDPEPETESERDKEPKAPPPKPDDCDKKTCKDTYPSYSELSEIATSPFNGFEHRTLTEAKNELENIKANHSNPAVRERAILRATGERRFDQAIRYGCRHPNNGIKSHQPKHYNGIKINTLYSPPSQQISGGSLGFCKVCDDSGGKPKLVNRYIVLNVKDRSGNSSFTNY